MKALDTPALLAILHDTPAGRELLKSLRGEEVATTELQMFELRVLAELGRHADRAPRETALSKLRRRLTVLPVTAESVAEAGRFLRADPKLTGMAPLVWGTLAAAGCSEWITSKSYAPARAKLPFKVRIIPS